MIQEFKVEGTGIFPVDMLRYDSCWPASSDDAIAIVANIERPLDWPGMRQILLRRYASTAHDKPHEKRWNSFGWRLLESRNVG